MIPPLITSCQNGVDLQPVERVAEHGEDSNADCRTPHRALAAGERGAAHDDDGDDVQLDVGADVRLAGPQSRRDDDPANARAMKPDRTYVLARSVRVGSPESRAASSPPPIA